MPMILHVAPMVTGADCVASAEDGLPGVDFAERTPRVMDGWSEPMDRCSAGHFRPHSWSGPLGADIRAKEN
jgi:hypothetical protein